MQQGSCRKPSTHSRVDSANRGSMYKIGASGMFGRSLFDRRKCNEQSGSFFGSVIHARNGAFAGQEDAEACGELAGLMDSNPVGGTRRFRPGLSAHRRGREHNRRTLRVGFFSGGADLLAPPADILYGEIGGGQRGRNVARAHSPGAWERGLCQRPVFDSAANRS